MSRCETDRQRLTREAATRERPAESRLRQSQTQSQRAEQSGGSGEPVRVKMRAASTAQRFGSDGSGDLVARRMKYAPNLQLPAVIGYELIPFRVQVRKLPTTPQCHTRSSQMPRRSLKTSCTRRLMDCRETLACVASAECGAGGTPRACAAMVGAVPLCCCSGRNGPHGGLLGTRARRC